MRETILNKLKMFEWYAGALNDWNIDASFCGLHMRR